MGRKMLAAMIQDGTAKTVGDASIMARLGAAMATFEPRFPIMQGTRLRTKSAPARSDACSAEALGPRVPE